MRGWIGFALVSIFCSSLALADASAGLQRLQQACPGAQFSFQQDRVARVFGTPLSFGASPAASAGAFVQTHSDVFGLSPVELAPDNVFDGQNTQPVMWDAQLGGYKFTLVSFAQQKNGVPVFRADLRLLVRNEEQYPLVLAASGLRDIGGFVPDSVALSTPLDPARYLAKQFDSYSTPQPVIWAGLENETVAPVLGYSFYAQRGTVESPDYARWLFIVEPGTGRFLYSEDQIIRTDITGNVSGQATVPPKSDTCNPEVVTPMPYAKVTLGATTVFADLLGNFTIPNSGSTPVSVSSPMAGQYFVVNNAAGSTETLTQNVTPPGPADFMHNAANIDELVRAQVNGYIQANVVRDFCLTYNPSYPTIAGQTNFPVYVNRTDLYCPGNAWYDGGAINFCRAGSTYPNTAYDGVVHHEYGHHMVASGGSGQGEYGEGMGDCIAILIANDPILGYGFLGNCNSGLRNADNNCQYSASGCSTCGSEIHDCGNLLSGCIWSVRTNLLNAGYPDYLAIASNLTVNSILLHRGTSINAQIAIDFLTLDDNDGNIQNGTPHYNEICAGFGAHGLNCPALALLGFNYPNGRPALLSPAGGVAFRVEVYGITGQPQPDSGLLYYKVGNGSWIHTPLQVVAPNVYDAVFPAIPCGSKVSYYVSAQTAANQVVTDPTGAPTSFYTAHSGYGTITAFSFDFEAATDEGWARGDTGDTATTGLWDRADPEPTAAQPGDDHTPPPGVKCWVTDHRAGNSIGDYDVDGGKTTIKSPVFDLSAYGNATIGYWRWYSNDQGSNPNTNTFRVDISNNGGTSWGNAETVGPSGPQTAGGWYYHEFDVTDKVPMSAQIRLRFVAEDATGAIVEAALDDFAITVINCTPTFATGDLNCDGAVDFDDINPFVLALSDPAGYQTAYPGCDIMNGDCNHDGAVDFDDINAFVALLGS